MTTPGVDSVVQLTAADAPRVVDVLCDAFANYPVMRFVIGDAGADYAHRLQQLVGFFVMARVLRDEPLFGIAESSGLSAAAIVSFPSRDDVPDALGAHREAVWQQLGSDARRRYDACGAAWRPLTVDRPHVHLNMIGVRRLHQGRGLAKRLLDRVRRLSTDTSESEGVSLTTEDPGNVSFYRHLGYEMVGHAEVAPELETWGFFLPTRTASPEAANP